MLRCFAALVLAALFVTSLAAGNFAGTISPAGYSPPPGGVWVTWCRIATPPECRSFQLNHSVPWDGQNGPTKFGRYSGGDPSVQGWSTVPAVAGEARGGEVGAALIALYRQHGGPAREYTNQELWDFAFANSCGSFSCGCSWYEGITGEPHPITPGCKNEAAAGDNGLRSCPNDPPGCGRNRANACKVDDPSLPADRAVSKPCWSGSGRVGRFMIRTASTVSVPTPKPEPIIPVPTPMPKLHCWLLKITGGGEMVSLEALTCPP